MLKNVIENYLISIKEVQFFAPFQGLLEGMGYYDIHLIHGPTEFGKDFIAKKDNDGETIQYCFQIKVGNVTLGKFTSEIKPQLLEIITNSKSHPNFDTRLSREIIFVTTGKIKPPATISFQEFNHFIDETLSLRPIITWEKEKLLNDFMKIGIEPFFELHNSPEFVSRFFDLFANIKKGYEFSSFDIVSYTDYWLTLDLSLKENKLQVLFESYFFSKLFLENEDHYNAVIILTSLSRVLIKEKLFDVYSNMLINSINYIILDFFNLISQKTTEERESYLVGNGLFSLLLYPCICLQTLELLALQILLADQVNESIKDEFLEYLKEKGASRPISDNFGSAIMLVALVLIKLEEIDILKKYLINITVWLCDRYEQNGIAPIGYKRDEEYEQIISEQLSGLSFHERKTCFISAIILDICFYIGDEELYSNIANDFRAVEIIPEYYHVYERNQLFSYDYVVTQTDHEFSLELRSDFAKYISYRKEKFELNFEENQAILLMFLLRDRYFPEIFLK